MKSEKDTAVVETAYDKPVTPPITYEFSWDAFESITEIRAANEFPKDSEVLNIVNAKRKANARAKQLQATLTANGIVKPTLENDPQVQLKTVYAALRAAKKTHEEARALAASSVGVDWAE